MKLKYEFAVRNIMDEYVLVPVGEAALAFSGMITTSEVGVFFVDLLKTDTTRDAMLEKLLEAYDVQPEEEAEDLDAFLKQLNELVLIENP